jgi:DNA-binding MarR family transcriptional regulator
MRLTTQIALEGSARFVDWVEALGYAPRTITDAVDALEADAPVERRPDPVDRRAKRISLTPAGEAAALRSLPEKDEAVAEWRCGRRARTRNRASTTTIWRPRNIARQ